VPGTRPYRPASSGDEEVDDAVAWINVLALFNEMLPAQRAQFIHYMGDVLYRLYASDMRHLESRERVLASIIARKQANVDT